MASPMSCTSLHKMRHTFSVLRLSKRIASTRISQSVFIEKTFEEPVIVAREEDCIDIIGPPDPLSNLRPIVRKILKNETALQRKFRDTADATQKWNQVFWELHNTNFVKEKEAYIKRHTSEEKPHLNADEMSEFYKDFLNKYWKKHVRYNFEWYGKNFSLLLLALRVNIQKLQRRLLY